MDNSINSEQQQDNINELKIKVDNLEKELNIYKHAIISECNKHNPLFHVESAELAELFIKYGANINDKNICNSTPLHYKKNKDIVELFIKNEFDLNTKDEYGCVPVMFYDDKETIKLMYNNGADLTICDNVGRSVIDYMKDNNKNDIILYINELITQNDNKEDITKEQATEQATKEQQEQLTL